jgi:hypothetical protein
MADSRLQLASLNPPPDDGVDYAAIGRFLSMFYQGMEDFHRTSSRYLDREDLALFKTAYKNFNTYLCNLQTFCEEYGPHWKTCEDLVSMYKNDCRIFLTEFLEYLPQMHFTKMVKRDTKSWKLLLSCVRS